MKKHNIFLLLILALPLTAQEYQVRGFSTDWSKIIIDPEDILSGGPPKDGIPSIDNPVFVGAGQADQWLGENEAVILVRSETETKAYPLQILAWHEIVNDTIGGIPISVTWCPLCNTTVVFRRRMEGRVLDFGTTGRLRFSNLLMYDRQTESWWQQADGKGVIGTFAGKELDLYPAVVVSWKDVREIPDLKVVSRETGQNRPYGNNPYRGYDDPEETPFLLDFDSRAVISTEENAMMDRALLIPLESGDRIYSYQELQKNGVTPLDGEDIVIFWTSGTASALDTSRVGSGRDVGTANAFSTRLEGRTLSFSLRRGAVTDRETQSRWNSLGEAVEGPLEGQKLDVVPSIQHFWFSAYLFRE